MEYWTPSHHRLSTRLSRVIGLTAAVPFGLLCMSPSWADTCTGYDGGAVRDDRSRAGHEADQLEGAECPVKQRLEIQRARWGLLGYHPAKPGRQDAGCGQLRAPGQRWEHRERRL